MNRWVALSIISVAVLFSLSLWFSATAVIPQLEIEWQLSSEASSSMTTAVQLGFIIGALVLTWTKLADTVNGRYLFTICAVIGAISNFLFTWSPSIGIGLGLRFLTGAMLAGIYPTAVRLVSAWFLTRKGTAVGIIIGALTIGSAMPHLIKTFAAQLDWEIVIYASSCLALLAAGIIFVLLPDVNGIGINQQTTNENAILKVIRNRPVMLSNYGYFGHNWELYAMWTWLPIFLMDSFQKAQINDRVVQFAPVFAFVIIGIAGAIGAIVGGLLADKFGKARLAKWAMIVSAICAIIIGFTYGQPLWLTIFIALIWGASVIADSAQFSALATEYAEPNSIGTALTFQMAVGFFITIVSIYLIPVFVTAIGWQWAFSTLAIGPVLGALAMNRLMKIR